jgi:tetratricopeptide (TPR) repeat protein
MPFLIFSGFMPLRMAAQEMGDSSLYNPGLRIFRQARSADEYVSAADYFDALRSHKPAQWLEYYYAALCYIKASYKVESNKTKDALMDKAQPCIDKAFGLKPEEPELWALQAFLYQSRIQVNPEIRGLSYSMKADAELKKATAADDGNPRAWSLMGYNVYHTPDVIGGGAQKALPLFLKAQDRYHTFRPVFPFLPGWGEPENQHMIDECKKAMK